LLFDPNLYPAIFFSPVQTLVGSYRHVITKPFDGTREQTVAVQNLPHGLSAFQGQAAILLLVADVVGKTNQANPAALIKNE